MMVDFEALLREAPFGDDQRTARALVLLGHLVKGDAVATAGTPRLGDDAPWAHTVGAFRFWNNPHITLPALYAPCRIALAQVIPRGARCYVAHDFSPLDFSTHHAKRDRVQVGNELGLGYDLYSALVLDQEGRPRGPLLQEVRCDQGVWSSEADTPLPFVDHLGQAERGLAAVRRDLPGRDVVNVYDREFDDIALQREIHSGAERYIIRAQHLRRSVLHADARSTLDAATAATALVHVGTLDVRTPQGEVTHDLWLGETSVVFDGASWRGRHRAGFKTQPGAPLTVRVVIAELRAPGRKTLRWVLLTNLADEAIAIVRAYYWRWRIERLFFFVKVGFRLESWRQESGAAIARRLALTSLAAMALYQLEAVADGDSNDARTANDTRKWVATRGGWLGRKGDSLGPIVLMRGMLLVVGALTLIETEGLDVLLAHVTALRRFLGGTIPDFEAKLRSAV